jgi:uncharacterized protein (DUF58 family)
MAVTWRVSGKVLAEGTTAALALLAAAVTGDVMLVALAAPLGLAVVLALTGGRPEPPAVTSTVTPLVVSPGDMVEISIEITSWAGAGAGGGPGGRGRGDSELGGDDVSGREGGPGGDGGPRLGDGRLGGGRLGAPLACEVDLSLPPSVRADGPRRWRLLLLAGRTEVVSCAVHATRPGRFRIGSATLRFTNRSGAVAGLMTSGEIVTLEVRPVPTRTGSLVRPERVRATAGDRVARLSSEGIEFSEVREQHAGALERRINWRATARRQATCVNLYHPERSTDVVLLVDTFADAPLPSIISVALNLADTYLRHHDRVGLICFGGVLDWVEPGTGPSQLDRLRASLLSSEAYFSYAWKTADVIPRRLFPAGSLVLAVSPLTDARFVSTLAALRSKAHDLAVIELCPAAQPPEAAVSLSGSLAWQILELEREEVRHRFWQSGVPISTIAGTGGVAGALAEIAAFRRGVRARSGVAR